MRYRQQPSPLLYSIEIWPARNSRLTQRETNHYITRCASVLACAWRSPEQLVIDLFALHQRFALCCPCCGVRELFDCFRVFKSLILCFDIKILLLSYNNLVSFKLHFRSCNARVQSIWGIDLSLKKKMKTKRQSCKPRTFLKLMCVLDYRVTTK